MRNSTVKRYTRHGLITSNQPGVHDGTDPRKNMSEVSIWGVSAARPRAKRELEYFGPHQTAFNDVPQLVRSCNEYMKEACYRQLNDGSAQ